MSAQQHVTHEKEDKQNTLVAANRAQEQLDPGRSGALTRQHTPGRKPTF